MTSEATPDPGWELPASDDGPPPPETLAWVAEQLGAAVVSAEPLYGGLSSAIHRLVLDRPGDSDAGGIGEGWDRVVLRRHTNASWMEREPDIPHHEARTLGVLPGLPVGVAVPALLAADPDGVRCDVPTIVMTEVPGRPELNPEDPGRYAEQLAACLVGIHGAPVPADLERYRRWDNPAMPVPVWVTNTDRWQQARDRVAGELPVGRPTFLHRDYHPNNIHWVDGEVCAVVDWLSACVGPVEADLAHCRWNLAILFDRAVAEHFTDHYRTLVRARLVDEVVDDQRLQAYDLSVVLSAPVGPFPTHAWNALGRPDLTPETVPPRIESWLSHILSR